MATVTGLPAEFEDDYELRSDSEPEDEADEDSNGGYGFLVGRIVGLTSWLADENFYKNDYPDEESSDDHDEDDEFGEPNSNLCRCERN